MIKTIDEITYIIRGKGEGKTSQLLHKVFMAKDDYSVYMLSPDKKTLDKFRMDYLAMYGKACFIKEFDIQDIEHSIKPVIIIVDELASFTRDNRIDIFNLLADAIGRGAVENIYITISGKVG